MLPPSTGAGMGEAFTAEWRCKTGTGWLLEIGDCSSTVHRSMAVVQHEEWGFICKISVAMATLQIIVCE